MAQVDAGEGKELELRYGTPSTGLSAAPACLSLPGLIPGKARGEPLSHWNRGSGQSVAPSSGGSGAT